MAIRTRALPTLLVLLVSVAAGSGCAASRSVPEATMAPAGMYPAWFLSVPEGGFAVGYSPPYHHEESSVEAAVQVAATAFAAEESLHITGGRGIVVDALGTYLPASDLREKVDEGRIVALSTPEHVVSVAETETLVMVLLARDVPSDEMRRTHERAWQALRLAEPDWVMSLPKDDTYVYGIGVATGYHHEASSWEVAERNARFELAHGFTTDVKARERLLDQQYESVTALDVDVYLQGVRIVERWRNLSDRSCYVLMRAPRP